ncbi:hypothetical protein PENSPDRAFT_755454 [Peniophora sp. CONT]|nr:hypothetical protein PENSPDRAFT_755454 [Peniophora sp. CONT]
MQTAIRALTTRYTVTLVNPACQHVLSHSTRAFSAFALAQFSTDTTLPVGGDIESEGVSASVMSASSGRKGHRISPNRIKRLISRGKSTAACQYILARTTRQGLSTDLAKRAVILEAFEAFLKHGAETEARTLQLALFGDAMANSDYVPEGYYGLLFLCLSELKTTTPISERKQADWRVRAHRRILHRAQPLLRDISADELARALDRLARVQHAGAQLCLALAGAFVQIHGNDSVSRRLGIQIARVASGALTAKSEAGFRQSMGHFSGAEKLVRGDEAPMPWAARALKALQRTSRLEHNFADAHHARRLRALYEERAKGKGPLEPVTFTLDELVKNDEGAEVPELSEIQLDLIAEGARMSLLATTLAQREDGEGPSSSERRTFRSIGARLAAFSRADFEQMSEVELDDLIARQEQYMKMTSLFSAGSLKGVAASEAQAPGVEAATQSDAPARAPENGFDTCTVAKPVQAAGSAANSSDTMGEGDDAVLSESTDDSPVVTSQPPASPEPTPDSLEVQLRSFAELLDLVPNTQNITLNVLGQRLVDKAIATREEFESGIVDQRGLDEMLVLIDRYKELQAAAEALALRSRDEPPTNLSFDEIVQRLHDAATSPSVGADAAGASLRPGVSTLVAATTFLAEIARHGSLKPAHITAALVTMTSRGIKPDARFFTVLITAAVRAGDATRAHALYDTMLRAAQSEPRCFPVSFTFASLFKAAELPRAKADSVPNPRTLFLSTPPEESGIRSPRTLFREMMNLHDRVTRSIRQNRMGSPAPGLPPVAIITRDSMSIALRAFLTTGDLPGALGVLHAYRELHIRPSHRTFNIVFSGLLVHIRSDLSRPRSIAGPASSRWSARFIGNGLEGLNDVQLMRRMYNIAIPEPRNAPFRVPTFPMVRGAQRLPRGARWDVDSLERLLEHAVYTGMEPKSGLEALTREVAREECERARGEMVPPPFKPGFRAKATGRVSRAWRAARLREKKRLAASQQVEEEPAQEGGWEF